MQLRDAIEKAIFDAVENVTDITQLNKDTSLISRELGIVPVDFLYVFDILQQRLQLSVYEIFRNHTYEVMTVGNLIDALFDLASQQSECKTPVSHSIMPEID